VDDGLQLTLLGKPGVRRDGAPVTDLAYKKSLALLYYLAVTGQPHTREHLAGLLWGEATEANARGGLRKSLIDLRRWVALHLTITRRQVALDRARPYWLDVEAFERRVDGAIDQGGSALTAEDAASLARAVELYRGDFLEGFHVRRAPAYEEWVLLQRERLRLSMLRALHALAVYYAARRAYGPAIRCVARVLALEPAQEEAHRQMMSLLARSGQQGAALRQYEVCRQALIKALDGAPDRETTALYERIREGAKGLAPPPIPARNLPAPLTPLVGRETELAEIAARLGNPACRLLTLVGPGGSGKTHLAQVAAAGQRERFLHGVCWVPLASLDAPEGIGPAISQTLGLSFHGEGTPREQLLAFLRHKQALLVMDGMEHLLAGVDLLVDLLRGAPDVKLLVTSRTRLNAGCEQLLPVNGLACLETEHGEPTPECLVDAARQPAVQLFLTGARRVRPGFALAEGDLFHVARICLQVDGLPLAILLAAGWMEILSPVEIAAQLCGPGGDGFDFLAADWPDLPQRQRSLRAVFDHSWDLLTEREQDVFAALSVFRGGFDGEAARQVVGASPRELLALVDQSLLQLAAPGRYVIHELLRQYAEERLASGTKVQTPLCSVPGAIVSNLQSQARDQHSAYFCAALQRWAADLRGARQQAALAEMDVEIANARVAWDRVVKQGQATRMAQAIDGLCNFFKWYGCYEEGALVCQTAAERLSGARPPPGVSTDEFRRALAKALAWQGVFRYLLGRNDQADELLRQSLTFLGKPGLAEQEPVLGTLDDVRPEKAFATWHLGKVMLHVDRAQARPLYEQSLATYRTLDDRWGMANVLEDLGWAACYAGDYGLARQLGEQDLALRRALDDQRGVSRSLRYLSIIAHRQGRLEEAENLIRESCAIPLARQSQAERADRFSGSGWIWMMLGHFLEGHSWLEESVSIWNDLGVANMGAYMSIPLGFAKIHLGQYEEGGALAQTGFDAARQAGDDGRLGLARFVLGWTALAQSQYAKASACLQESVTLFRALAARDRVGEILALLGYAARGLGQCAQARRYLCEALQIAAELEVFLPIVFALPAVALLWADRGEPEQAVELYGLASRYPFVANSRWFEDIAGREIAAAASTLPPEVVAAAEERGRARDLWATVEELLVELVEQQGSDTL
jgi:DNA-binding SARP family transcriptional activator